MLQTEFTVLTGIEVTPVEYAAIEEQYMACSDTKSEFCEKWLKSYKKEKKAERAKFIKEHSIERLFAYMEGVVSLGGHLTAYDFEIDKEVIGSTKSEGAKLYWAVRPTGTELFLYNIEALHRWNEQRGNRDDFAQYEITCLGKGLFEIEKIK